MSQEVAKKEYKILLENGELLDMFPHFTGQWSKDKKEFIQYQEMNEKIFNDLDVDLDDDFEDLYQEL